MNTAKYHLLRKFNALAAKAGEPICTDKAIPLRYVTGPRVDGRIVVEDGENYLQCDVSELRMAPLVWADDVPLYAGLNPSYNPIPQPAAEFVMYGCTSAEQAGTRTLGDLLRGYGKATAEVAMSGYVELTGLTRYDEIVVLRNRVATLTTDLRKATLCNSNMGDELINLRKIIDKVSKAMNGVS